MKRASLFGVTPSAPWCSLFVLGMANTVASSVSGQSLASMNSASSVHVAPRPVKSLGQLPASEHGLSAQGPDVVARPAPAAHTTASDQTTTLAAPPDYYVDVMVSTTMMYHPNGGNGVQGPQGDVTPIVGFARYLTPTVAIEIDVAATFTSAGFSGLTFVPAVVWMFHPNVYAAMRFLVQVHPVQDFALFPGIGISHTFSCNVTPFFEVEPFTFLGRGLPDFGLAMTAGALYSF